ncbi:nucleoid-associated protein [Marinobacter segnicrescens]|uniref:nucleoid-associated protein n=1 Tax=Pseudomonadales TaxID=72274 RepID=UPI003A90BCC1
MIDISSARLIKIAVHKVGNKVREEGISLAEKESSFSETLSELLSRHFLLPLSKQEDIYDFFHESDLSLNAISNISDKIFDNSGEFVTKTQGIAKHLYSTSNHPNISGGDVVFLLFSGIRVEEVSTSGLAILKIESKDDFIDIKESSGSFDIIERIGISLNRIQKGALILPDSQGVYVVDNLGQKTKYWINSFLKVTPRATSKSYAKICGSILKGITSKIDDAQDVAELNEKINEKINSTEALSIGEIKALSSQYIDSSSLSEVVSGVTSSTGVDVSDEYEFTSQDFAKQTKPITSRVKVRDGVGLVISNSKYLVSGVSINDHKNGFQATIDIKIRKEK